MPNTRPLDLVSPLDELLVQVRACSLCAQHLPYGPRPVLQAHPAARILVVGQAPGRRVHQSGLPFDDPSGDRLRAWLGVDRSCFYDPRCFAMLPMGFCYPGTGRSGDLPPRPECALAWRTQLLSCLPKVELSLVIGQYALAWHLKDRRQETLTATVKAWRTYWPAVLPLPHPSPRNNLWLKRNPWFEQELLTVLPARVAQILGKRP